MTRRTSGLIDLAGAIADGQAVDWPAMEEQARTPAERRRVRQLRVLAQVAEVHRDPLQHLPPDLGGFVPDASHAPRRPLSLAPGAEWGPLRIVGRLGAGTFGEVYRARDPRLDRDVALKLLHAAGEHTESEIIEEGRLLARIRHPNVVAVFGADRIDGRVGIWMELVEGHTLADEVRRQGTLSARETLRIGIALGEALSAVHAAGLLHRDIKAQNVIRDQDGRVVLMDFSAGREASAVPHRMPVSVAGSPIYIAPEILEGRPATPQSDVYSLGVLLFHLATGQFPVTGASLSEIHEAHRSRGPSSLSALRPDLDSGLGHVVDRAIAPDPAARIQSGRELVAELATVERASTTDAIARHRWRRPLLSVALLGVVVGAGLLRQPSKEPMGIGPAARERVLLGAVENGTGDPRGRDVVTEVLRRTLQADTVVSPVPENVVSQMLAFMRQSRESPVDLRTAREIAGRDGSIRIIVSGRISRRNAGGRLVLDATGASDGALLASVADDFDDGDLRVVAGRAAAVLTSRLSALVPALPPLPPRQERVTTSSWQALQLYSRAAAVMDDRMSQTGIEERAAAEPLLRQAVALDPEFASAWLLLARSEMAQHPFTTAYASDLERAVTLANGVSASERNRILGWWHVRRNDLTGDLRELEAAAPIYEALLEAEPGDASAAEALQHVYQTLGRQDDADDVVMRFATANPGSPSASLGMAQVHMRRGELQDSREITRRVLAMAASDAADHRGIGASGATPAQTSTATDLRTPRDDVLSWAHLWDAHAAWLANDPRGALAAADRARAGWRPEGSRARAQWGWYLASVYEGLGRFDSAESVIRELWAPEFRDRDLAHLAVLRGDLPEARALLAPHLRFEEAIHAATLLAWAGEFERAEWLEDQRRVRGINPPRRQSAVDEGVLRVAEGRYVETVQVLEPFLPSARLGTGIYLVLLESLATARSALNDRDGAIELLEPLTATRASVVIGDWDVYYWLRCRVLLAELYTEKGRAADAARVAGEVRQLLGVAAADHPLLVRLRTNCRC